MFKTRVEKLQKHLKKIYELTIKSLWILTVKTKIVLIHLVQLPRSMQKHGKIRKNTFYGFYGTLYNMIFSSKWSYITNDFVL